ncbi:MAG: DUF418 domain-containing transporter [Myxococcales bacterium]|nr:DUF418 domain-containing transporter [Myxococcales bacterium]
MPSDSRLHALDGLRGLAVFLMMEQHIGIWLWRVPAGGARQHPGLVAFNALGGLAAPLFITLAGVGAALMIARARGPVDRTLVTRGLWLMGFGYALNLMTPHWFGPLSWFVLHLIGLGLATTPLWRRASTPRLLLVAATLVAATTAAHVWLRTPLHLGFSVMNNHARPGGVLRLALVEGHFPALPWLAVFILGLVAGRDVVAGRRGAVARLALILLAVGASLGLLGRALPLRGADIDDPLLRGLWLRLVRVHLDFYPGHLPIVALLAAAALLLVYLGLAPRVRGWLDARSPAVTLGRASLTLLIVHVVLFHEGGRALGLYYGLSATTTLLIIAAWTALCVLGTRAWQRRGYAYGAEWALRRLAG